MMQNQPDHFVQQQMRDNFDFVTGVSRPVVKKAGQTHVDGNTVEDHFMGGPSFMHVMLFMRAFDEVKARGLFADADEQARCTAVWEAFSG